MQKLHLVGPTAKADGLVFSVRKGAKSGSYVIKLDDTLLASIDKVQRARNGDGEAEGPAAAAVAAVAGPAGPGGAPGAYLPAVKPAKPSSALSPREIQARLRAGATTAEVAAAAGVDEEWVLRFAAPIRAEQARVVDRARLLTFVKPRLGPSAEPLGESVQWNLADKGVAVSADVFDDGWSAYSLHGTTWAVRFSYTSRSRVHTAIWQVDLRTGEVAARGRLASELGYVEPGRKRHRLEPLEEPSAPVPGAKAKPASRGGASAASAASAATPKASAGGRSAAKLGAPAVKSSGRSTAPAGKSSGRSNSSPAGKSKSPTGKSSGRSTPPAGKSSGRSTGRPTSSPDKPTSGPGPARPKSEGGSRPPGVRAPAGGAAAPAAAEPAPAATSRPGRPGMAQPLPEPERPTHLARPPSPMSSANRAPNQPGRLAGAPSLRPAPPVRRPPPRPAPRPAAAAPPPEPAAAPAVSPAPSGADPGPPASAGREQPEVEAFKPAPLPARPAKPARRAPVRPVPVIPPMAVPSVIEVGDSDPEPAIVVLSTPVRRRPAPKSGPPPVAADEEPASTSAPAEAEAPAAKPAARGLLGRGRGRGR